MPLAKFLGTDLENLDAQLREKTLNEFESRGEEVGRVQMGNSIKVFSQMPRINALRERLNFDSDYYFNVNLYLDPDTKSPKPDPIDCYRISPAMKKIWDEIDLVEDRELKDMLRIRFCQLVEFDFKKVADYYVKCDDKMKDLFERLALVVIDYESAIEKGFFDVLKSINEFGEVKCNNTVYADRNKVDGRTPVAKPKEEKPKKKPIGKKKEAAEPEDLVAENAEQFEALLSAPTEKKISYDLDL